jgi:hypothetical protein
MGENGHEALLLLGPPLSGTQGVSQHALVAREEAFHLPALPVDAREEAPLHLAPIPCLGPPSTAPARVERDHGGAEAQLFATQPMIMFGVVGGIPQEAVPLELLGRLPHRSRQLGRVLRRAPTHHGPSDQMGLGFCDDRHFGPAAAPKAAIAFAVHVVAADMASFQARGVYAGGRAQAQQSSGPGSEEDLRLQRGKVALLGQAALGIAESGVVGHLRQADRGPHLRTVGQELDQAAVVGAKELPQYQAGEQLRLGVAARREFVRIRGQGCLSYRHSHLSNGLGRFAHAPRGLIVSSVPGSHSEHLRITKSFSTEH